MIFLLIHTYIILYIHIRNIYIHCCSTTSRRRELWLCGNMAAVDVGRTVGRSQSDEKFSHNLAERRTLSYPRRWHTSVRGLRWIWIWVRCRTNDCVDQWHTERRVKDYKIVVVWVASIRLTKIIKLNGCRMSRSEGDFRFVSLCVWCVALPRRHRHPSISWSPLSYIRVTYCYL